MKTTAKKQRKPRFMHEDSREFQRLANEVARSFVVIVPCRECGGPVNSGYQCRRCNGL